QNLGADLQHSPSAAARFIRGRYTKAEPGELVWEIDVRPDMTNPAGVLHGGVVALIADDLIGAAVFTLGRETLFTSINLTVDFLAAAIPGEVVTARAAVTREGKSIINMECWIHKADGRLLAHATSNMFNTGKEMPL